VTPTRGLNGAAVDLGSSVGIDADEVISPEELGALRIQESAVQDIAEQTTYGEILLEDLIRRQLSLSLNVAAVFVGILFGLPLVNLFFPQVVAMPVFGIPLGWIVLAVLLYPMLWGLAAYFVSTSRKYEDEFTELVK